MTLFALVRLYLRRYRVLFLVLVVFAFLHEVGFLFIFQFWKKQAQLSDFIVSLLPARIRTGMGIPMHDLTDPRTYKALIYMRPDSRIIALLFGVTLGTDVIAGEIGRGTGDLVFSHPVRRGTAVLAGMLTTALHIVCVGAATLLGFMVGTEFFPMGAKQPAIAELLPATSLIVIASFVISLLAFLFGSICRTRGQALGWSLLCIVVPFVLEFMGLFTALFTKVARLFPEHYYRPHTILMGMDYPKWSDCVLALTAIAAVCIAGSLFFAARRDLSR